MYKRMYVRTYLHRQHTPPLVWPDTPLPASRGRLILGSGSWLATSLTFLQAWEGPTYSGRSPCLCFSRAGSLPDAHSLIVVSCTAISEISVISEEARSHSHVLHILNHFPST